MSKISDYLKRKINSHFVGELIYLKIEGNDSIGYLSTIQYFNVDRLYIKKNNVNLPDSEISHSGHLKEEFMFSIKIKEEFMFSIKRYCSK